MLKTHRLSTDRSSMVSTELEWLPMFKAPMGKNVLAITTGHVAVTAVFGSTNLKHFLGWLPPPEIWNPIDTLPIGVKVIAKTVGGVVLPTLVTQGCLKSFVAWTPLPKEPAWMKEM